MNAADRPQLRLGLALSGGGFRASFFHLGALRRLAELGLLRHVSDISTVSGGSILAAHYYLRFREKFEDTGGKLDDSDYVEIVKEVEDEFIQGNGKDLRNRLLYDPLTHLRAFVLGRGYGNRMAQLYTRFFYRNVIETIDKRSKLAGAENWLKEGIPLHQSIVIKPDQPSGDRLQNKSSSYPNSDEPELMLAEFNRKPEYATIPRLVINATCLNEGGPFHFMLNEVGGPETGYVRFDEVFMLLQYKMLITSIRGRRIELGFLRRVMRQAVIQGERMERTFAELPSTAFKLREAETDPIHAFPAYTVEHLSMYLAAKGHLSDDGADGHSWPTSLQPTSEPTRWLASSEGWPSMRHLMECDYGSLRRAKLAAWYLLDEKGWGNGSRGGRTREDYRNAFWSALAAIDEPIVKKFSNLINEDFERLTTFLVDLYYLRSAESLDWEAPSALRKLTLSHAVAGVGKFPARLHPL